MHTLKILTLDKRGTLSWRQTESWTRVHMITGQWELKSMGKADVQEADKTLQVFSLEYDWLREWHKLHQSDVKENNSNHE